jgi:hypothetical protein
MIQSTDNGKELSQKTDKTWLSTDKKLKFSEKKTQLLLNGEKSVLNTSVNQLDYS